MGHRHQQEHAPGDQGHPVHLVTLHRCTTLSSAEADLGVDRDDGAARVPTAPLRTLAVDVHVRPVLLPVRERHVAGARRRRRPRPGVGRHVDPQAHRRPSRTSTSHVAARGQPASGPARRRRCRAGRPARRPRPWSGVQVRSPTPPGGAGRWPRATVVASDEQDARARSALGPGPRRRRPAARSPTTPSAVPRTATARKSSAVPSLAAFQSSIRPTTIERGAEGHAAEDRALARRLRRPAAAPAARRRVRRVGGGARRVAGSTCGGAAGGRRGRAPGSRRRCRASGRRRPGRWAAGPGRTARTRQLAGSVPRAARAVAVAHQQQDDHRDRRRARRGRRAPVRCRAPLPMKTSPRMSTTAPKTTVDTVEPSVWPRTSRWPCDSSSPSSAISSQPSDVQQDARAAEDRQHHEQDPEDQRVDAGVPAEAAGDAGQLAVGAAAAQRADRREGAGAGGRNRAAAPGAGLWWSSSVLMDPSCPRRARRIR